MRAVRTLRRCSAIKMLCSCTRKTASVFRGLAKPSTLQLGGLFAHLVPLLTQRSQNPEVIAPRAHSSPVFQTRAFSEHLDLFPPLVYLPRKCRWFCVVLSPCLIWMPPTLLFLCGGIQKWCTVDLKVVGWVDESNSSFKKIFFSCWQYAKLKKEPPIYFTKEDSSHKAS